MGGFQKRRKPEEWSKPRLARVRYTTGQTVECSCGWYYGHIRPSVIEDAIDRHLQRRHEGKGFRL